MKRLKKVTLILTITIFSGIFTSCWNYKEINDVEVVLGAAINIDKKNNQYVLISEVLVAPGKKGDIEIQSRLVRSKGVSFYDAVRNFIELNGKIPYWAHTKVIIISDGTAGEGVVPVIDLVSRNPEVRPDMNILVSSEKTAEEILVAGIKEVQSASFKIKDTLKSNSSIGTYEEVDLWNFTHKLSEEGVSPVAPLVSIDRGVGKSTTKVSGLAVFKEDKMIGSLSGEETKYYLFTQDKIEGPLLVMRENDDGKEVKITLEVYRNKTKLKAIKKEGKLAVKVDIKTDVGIGEIAGTANFIEKEKREQVEKHCEEMIKVKINNLVQKVQEQYNSDIFGFGRIIKKQMPDEWKKVGEKWDEKFKELEVDVNADVTIVKTELTSEPIKVGD